MLKSLIAGAGLTALLLGGHMAFAQTGQNVDWSSYNADITGSRFKPLDQINASNFSKLEVAWRFKTDNIGNRPEFKLEGTPLEVGGVVYATAGSRRGVIALDAVTGELLWVHGEKEGARGALRFHPDQLAFYGDLVESLGAAGRCEIHSLHVGDRCIAMKLCVLSGNELASFKICYDESAARLAPGAGTSMVKASVLPSGDQVMSLGACSSVATFAARPSAIQRTNSCGAPPTTAT